MGRPGLFDLTAFLYGVMTAQATWRASCARLATYFPATPNPRVLDLGCGPGVSTIVLAQQCPDAMLVGLDRAPHMLDQAQYHTARAQMPDRIRYVLADATQLPFASASLDMVTGHSFLYLVRDRNRVVAEAYRVLKRGGRIASMEPHEHADWGAILHRWREARYMLSISLWRPYSRLHTRFTRDSFEALLRRVGFRDVRIELVQDTFGIIGSGEKP